MNLSLTKNKNIFLFFLTLACVSGIGKFFIASLLCFIIYYYKNKNEFLEDLSSLKIYKSSFLFMILFLVTLFISGLFVESDTWLKLVRNNLQRMLPFFFVILGLNGKGLFNEKIKYILLGCCVSIFIICVPVLDKILIDGLYRPYSILGSPNILGGSLILVFPLIVSFILLINENKMIFVFSIISICVLLITLLLIKSRGSWLGLGAMFALIPFVLYKINTITLKKLILIELLLCLLAVASYLYFYNDLHRSYDFERPALREIAWQMFLANPIGGVGAGNFISTYVNENYVSPLVNSKHILVHPHNIYFNYLSEHGIFGFSGFIALIIFQLKVLWYSIIKRQNVLSIAMFLAIIGMLVHGWFDVCFSARYYAMTYWLLWGIVCYYILIKNNKF